MTCANQAENQKNCNCTYKGCPRHAVCCECVKYHKSAGELPACYFSAADEKTYDRSIKKFIAVNSKK